jgi:hypothetical protein
MHDGIGKQQSLVCKSARSANASPIFMWTSFR